MPASDGVGQNFEDHVVSVLDLAHDGIVLLLGAGGLLVDPGDDQPGFKPLQVGERPCTDRLNDDSGHMGLRGCGIGLLTNYEAQLAFTGIGAVLGVGIGLLGALIGEDLIEIADGDGGVHGLAVALIAEANGGPGAAAGDLADEVVSVLNRATINRGDYVPGLEPCLFRGAVRRHRLHQDAGLEAVYAIDGAGKPLIETNSNGSRVTLWLAPIRSL